MKKIFISLIVGHLLFQVGLVWAGQYSFALLFGLYWIPLAMLGIRDMCQTKHAVTRNFPVIGHFRYLLEMIRPEINQYFIESNTSGRPFSREQRSLVYQRAKATLDTLPFGTQKDYYEVGHEWVCHSFAPLNTPYFEHRVTIGSKQCKKPYSASLLNISAMSFGALSKNAIMSLNGGAKLANMYHNTGEGGLSPYHLSPGGDLVWQLGTAYFSARDLNGNFSEDLFAKKCAQYPNIKMVELKLSQGAKPGHGGILPASKLTHEIAQIRNVPMGQNVISPPGHKSFSTPIGMMEFVKKLRDLSGGLPIGIKFCLGRRREFISICKAILATNIYPDYIVVDGGEGGTGAAPLEFSNHVGFPLREAIIFVHNSLRGFGLRDEIKVIASGRILSGFDMISRMAIGADICNSARGMMMALGCIQALRCNSNSCPVGVATQDPELVRGLDVSHKTVRVKNYHHETLKSMHEILMSMGLPKTQDLQPHHIIKRVSDHSVKNYAEIYDFLQPNSILNDFANIPFEYQRFYASSSEKTWDAIGV